MFYRGARGLKLFISSNFMNKKCQTLTGIDLEFLDS